MAALSRLSLCLLLPFLPLLHAFVMASDLTASRLSSDQYSFCSSIHLSVPIFFLRRKFSSTGRWVCQIGSCAPWISTVHKNSGQSAQCSRPRICTHWLMAQWPAWANPAHLLHSQPQPWHSLSTIMSEQPPQYRPHCGARYSSLLIIHTPFIILSVTIRRAQCDYR